MAPADVPALEASLGRVRFATLGVLAVCAVMALLHRTDAPTLPPGLERLATPLSLGLAVTIFIARQVAGGARGRTRLRAILATYLLSAGLGLFGALLAVCGDDGSRGALFAFGAAIFTLGTPPGLGLAGASLVRRR